MTARAQKNTQYMKTVLQQKIEKVGTTVEQGSMVCICIWRDRNGTVTERSFSSESNRKEMLEVRGYVLFCNMFFY